VAGLESIELETAALDQCPDRAIEMAATADASPDWSQAILPPHYLRIGCASVLHEQQAPAGSENPMHFLQRPLSIRNAAQGPGHDDGVSVDEHETNSNFGFNLSVWDRLFRTYKPQPDAGHDGITIGIRDHRDPKQVCDLAGMLALPFLGADVGYAINRRQWGSTS